MAAYAIFIKEKTRVPAEIEVYSGLAGATLDPGNGWVIGNTLDCGLSRRATEMGVDVDGADDVSSRASLAGVTTLRLATKRLLLDLTTLTDRVPMALRTMSNFEGLAAGPPAPDGSPTLIVISDDNFRASQTFAVMWLKLRLQ